MLGDQFKFLALFYVNPRKAASAVLDQGKFLFALIAAVVITFAIGQQTERLKSLDFIDAYQSVGGRLNAYHPMSPELDQARRRTEVRYLGSTLKSVALMGLVFAPICVLILAAVFHLGGATTVLYRDYMPVLVGLLFAWTAAQLPIALMWWSGLVTRSLVMPLQVLEFAYFLGLAGVVLSTVTGVSIPQALLAEVGGLAASAGAFLLFANSGGMLYMLASPWVLYFLYQRFGQDIGALGGGLSQRQNFKRQLEAATVNPRDADAHYQLGLIYVQRRSLTEAEKSFRRALAIDPNEPEVLFQLGRLLRLQGGQSAEARDLLERGAQFDPKLASHQIWRELGAVLLETSAAEALPHLEYYVHVREYDPEGLVLYGRALRAMGREAEAKSMFERAVEAARSAPKFRRTEVAPWERQARQELKG